jgi:hypothetical protein
VVEFVAALSAAEDVDGILLAHADYLAAVHQRCLLHTHVAMVRQVALRLLNLALVFSARWEEGLQGMRQAPAH